MGVSTREGAARNVSDKLSRSCAGIVNLFSVRSRPEKVFVRIMRAGSPKIECCMLEISCDSFGHHMSDELDVLS